MATLPQSSVTLQPDIEFTQQPTLTWYVDPSTRRIRGTADGHPAITQAVEIILNVERFYWQIYSPNFGMQWRGLIGKDPGYVAAEMQRRILDAFSVDARILGIANFKYSVSGSTLTASMTVRTVYGDTDQTVEVDIT